MTFHRKKIGNNWVAVMAFCFLFIGFNASIWADTVETDEAKNEQAAPADPKNNTESQSDIEDKMISRHTKKLEQAGEKVGREIDLFSQKASLRIGSWINMKVFYGITWLKLILCFLLLFVALIFERIVRLIIDRKIRKKDQTTEIKKIQHYMLEASAKPLSMLIWTYGIYLAITPIFTHFQKPDGANPLFSVAQKAADLGFTIALFWFIYKMVVIVDVHLKKWAGTTESTIDDVLAPLLGKTLRVFIVIIGGVIIVQNLTGVKIGPLLASLGIGGIAVALAAKDSIANFFGTLTILFDKPFQVGERILIDSYDGVIEDVGFRSTRIRTLNGHLVTIPNEKIVSSGLENIGRRTHIRWLTNITITYDTPPDKVEKAVSIIKDILQNHEGMHPDYPPRVYFNGFNDWSLNILVIAWYHPPNYWDMQSWLQQTCLEILRLFNDEGINFAFPSRTVY
ncbi:MAG: mechanosensitive ion channel family protein, partial [Desulfatitalea sp.]|nr:mechanosensitive ion channel family protein [Desulfatitalea sp.]NNK02120.1 mechanosensitive ion channel family protein [Desulfatitalea sp.]